MNISQFASQVSAYASAGEPFVFLIDFEMKKPLLYKLADASREGIWYNLNGNSNIAGQPTHKKTVLEIHAVEQSLYNATFSEVIRHLHNGDTFLLNLTYPTPISLNLTPEEVFNTAKAPYKLLLPGCFVVFSPECFIKTSGGFVYTYPMKGTIDALIPQAETLLLNNKKEEWEHNTIVDLMRNDLSMIASGVQVTKYRFIQKISTHKNEILQTSSEICGKLPADWRNCLGESLINMLPAGSVSGAPKRKTLEIIRKLETGPRGYYTGIFGMYDGSELDTAVAIRFIEFSKGKLYFRSGGGITAMSDPDEEYNELIQKIYVPAF